jgi:rhamnogalacturonan endolyase
MKQKKHFALWLAMLLCTTASAQNTPQSQIERLDRGVVALPAAGGTGNFISWRFLGTDDEEATRFDIIRNGVTIQKNVYKTNYEDKGGTKTAKYQIVTKVDGEETATTDPVGVWNAVYLPVALSRPATGPNGGVYAPNDCSVGDVDGDGQYEIFVKWQPDNAKDNSQSGITDNTIIDCYRLDGTKLWRVDLGRNIRSGAHYTQFMVYDFDGDGHAEMMCKTGPGSLDGTGHYVNEAATDETIKAVSGTALYRSDAGRITGGQEWLTVFDGQTGQAIHTIFYNPNRNMNYGGAADGSVNWGVGGKNDTGSYGNRGERFLAAVASLGGPDENASAIFCRGYYDYAFIWAVDFDGQQLHQRWFSSHKNGSSYTLTTFDANGKGTSKTYSNCKPTRGSGSGTMYQNGNHNMSVADVDGDGCDEIIWGSAALDHNGRLLYGTGWGHGDAIHLADHCPDRPGLEVFQIHEGNGYGWDLHDAATGEILFSATGGADNGRGIAGNFDAKTHGSLFWSSNDGSPRSAVTGQTVYQSGGSSNFRVYWDGDLLDELLDGSKLDKFKSGEGGTNRLFTIYNAGPGSTCNGSKNTPNLQADILGDWREEIILHDGSSTLAIYSTNTTTVYRMPTLMHDHTYRMGICWQNTAYNQPPHLGYFLPDAMLPYFINDVDELTIEVGKEMEPLVLQGRYTSVISQSQYIVDGVKKSGMPAGLTKTIDIAAKRFTLAGTPTQPGDYQLLVNLRSLSSELIVDTINIHVTDAVGIAEVNSRFNGEDNDAIYDLQGRRVGSSQFSGRSSQFSGRSSQLRRGIYITRRGLILK